MTPAGDDPSSQLARSFLEYPCPPACEYGDIMPDPNPPRHPFVAATRVSGH